MCVHRVCPRLECSRETENTLCRLIKGSTKSLLPGNQMLANRSLQALCEKAGKCKLSTHLAQDKTQGQTQALPLYFNFFFSHAKNCAIIYTAQIDFNTIMQGAGQYRIHSAQSYISYWVVIHFVTLGYNSGMSPPVPVELHFGLKQTKKVKRE